MAYDPAEQDEVIEEFVKLLRMATADGGRKREKGLKPSWKIDPSHEAAMYRHLGRYWLDPGGLDADSKAPHSVAIAWRALALAWQQLHYARYMHPGYTPTPPSPSKDS